MTKYFLVEKPNTIGKNTTKIIELNTFAIGMLMLCSINTLAYRGVSSEPKINPITVISTAAGKLPLVKPVQEIVIPLVGTSDANNRPSAA